MSDTETTNRDRIVSRITILEMEVGFLRSLGRSPNPLHRIEAAEIELARTAEVESLKKQLEHLGMSA